VRISENECVCVGGRDEAGAPSAKIQLLVKSGDNIKVTQCGSMNNARFNAAAIYYHDTIYISGGENEGGKMKSVEYVPFNKGHKTI
jgi:hypothetical protein